MTETRESVMVMIKTRLIQKVVGFKNLSKNTLFHWLDISRYLQLILKLVIGLTTNSMLISIKTLNIDNDIKYISKSIDILFYEV